MITYPTLTVSSSIENHPSLEQNEKNFQLHPYLKFCFNHNSQNALSILIQLTTLDSHPISHRPPCLRSFLMSSSTRFIPSNGVPNACVVQRELSELPLLHLFSTEVARSSPYCHMWMLFVTCGTLTCKKYQKGKPHTPHILNSFR